MDDGETKLCLLTNSYDYNISSKNSRNIMKNSRNIMKNSRNIMKNRMYHIVEKVQKSEKIVDTETKWIPLTSTWQLSLLAWYKWIPLTSTWQLSLLAWYKWIPLTSTW
jgi:hypothetical protein